MTGKTFEEFHAGERYVTGRRTITEHDILQFVTLVGLTEPLFLDMEYIRNESLYGERIAPGSLTFGMAEGLTVQTGLIHGTGMSYLGSEIRIVAPVLEGDTLRVSVTITDKRETKKPDRGIVTYRHEVTNQRGEVVLEAAVKRMIKRKPA